MSRRAEAEMADANQIERDIPLKRVMEAVENGEDVGFCIACGDETYGVEPDARNYECPVCGAAKVFGAEETLLMVMA